jgi:hypothetical protein
VRHPRLVGTSRLSPVASRTTSLVLTREAVAASRSRASALVGVVLWSVVTVGFRLAGHVLFPPDGSLRRRCSSSRELALLAYAAVLLTGLVPLRYVDEAATDDAGTDVGRAVDRPTEPTSVDATGEN